MTATSMPLKHTFDPLSSRHHDGDSSHERHVDARRRYHAGADMIAFHPAGMREHMAVLQACS
jgi:hypothetical protein